MYSKIPWGENLVTSCANGLGGAYTNEYNYDDLYRLTSANGSYAGNNTNYSLEMSYTPAGRLCSKLQDFTGTGNVYAYSQNNKPHAVRRYYNGITNELSNLRWDNNGNLAQQTVYSVNNNVPTFLNMRMLFWDEDDRLNLVAGDGYLSYYAYGHDGNRAIKMTGNAAIDQTGMLLNSTNLENITIYPNEYLTVTQSEYTKYYYAGGNRIASKIGTGGFEKMTRLCTLDQGPTYNANTLLNFVLYQVTNTTQPPTDEYPVDVCGGYSVATELLADPLPDFYISQTNLNFTQNNLLQQLRQNLTNSVEPVYYFHSDHLGSASWITNNTGLPVQHLLYLPFGEHFVNERSAAYDERFTFTGKERDAETGYYYHGARFNSSDIGWLSVDPMADKYPSMSPYAYCAWNPVKLVDPEGEEIDVEDLGSGTYKIIGGKLNDNLNVYVNRNGQRTGVILGQTFTKYSFFDGNNNLKKDVIIDMNDNSGQNFLDHFIKNTPSINTYVFDDKKGGRTGGECDFKNRDLNEDMNATLYRSRGMTIDVGDGKKIASAKDIGNYAAGYIAGKKGLSWFTARKGFDTYEMISNKKFKGEPPVTKEAEWLGYKDGLIKGGGWKSWIPFLTNN